MQVDFISRRYISRWAYPVGITKMKGSSVYPLFKSARIGYRDQELRLWYYKYKSFNFSKHFFIRRCRWFSFLFAGVVDSLFFIRRCRWFSVFFIRRCRWFSFFYYGFFKIKIVLERFKFIPTLNLHCCHVRSHT